MGKFESRVVLVTGAQRGIGAASVRLFHQEGATVVATDLDKPDLDGVTGNGDDRLLALKLDVRSESDWADVLDKVVNRYGRLDVLVNNAGIAIAKDIEATSLVEWRDVMSVNADGTFLGTKHAIAAMKLQDGGAIVNVSSAAGIVGVSFLAAYSASKAAVRLLTKSAALHCAERGYGIRINSVHPSFTETAMLDGLTPGDNRASARRRLARSQPLGRLAKPTEVAKAILFLACDDSSFMTGSEIVVDGGATAQ